MRSLLKAALSLGLLTLVACTAIVTSDDPVQCNNDGDCTKRGPDFVDSMCSNGLCVAKPPTVSTTDSGASSSGVIKPNAECTKNADCASKGDKFVCSSNIGECAPTESEDCKVVYGDPTVEGTILYGLMSEIATTDTQYFRQVQHRIAALGGGDRPAGLGEHAEPFLGREQRRLARVNPDRQNETIDQPRGVAHDVDMAVGHRIERAGIKCDSWHRRGSYPGRMTIATHGIAVAVRSARNALRRPAREREPNAATHQHSAGETAEQLRARRAHEPGAA